MLQNVVLVIVLVVSVWAHVWLYLWMKFKMDEGAIMRCLKDHHQECSEQKGLASTDAEAITQDINTNVLDIETIAGMTGMKPSHVSKVCLRSKSISESAEGFYCQGSD